MLSFKAGAIRALYAFCGRFMFADMDLVQRAVILISCVEFTFGHDTANVFVRRRICHHS